jgi:hypothetical protein
MSRPTIGSSGGGGRGLGNEAGYSGEAPASAFWARGALGRAAPTRIRTSDGCAECPHVATSMRRPRRQHGDETVTEV